MKHEEIDGWLTPPLLFENEILTACEAAEYVKLSTKTLLKHVRAGNLPARRIGRSYRFLRSTLIEWVKER